MSLLGLDIGTTGCKAAAFNIEGEMLAFAYREYPLIFPQAGWIELDGRQVWHHTQEAIREVAAKTKDDPIKALSVSAQGEAVTPLDKNGNILYNSIVTFDTRTSEYVEWWEKRLSKQEIFQTTGMPLHGMYTINKIMWVRDNLPGIFARADKFLCYEDLVFKKLGLTPTIDFSLAARTMAFGLAKKRWSEKILSHAEIDPSLLPEIKPSGTVVGTIPGTVAQQLGLPKGVVAVTGGHDQPCGALGAGIVEPGIAMYATGTVECITPALSRPVLNKRMLENNFSCYPHTCKNMYVTIAFNFSGGSLLRWFRDNFADEERRTARSKGIDVYDLLISQVPEKPGNLFILPHFTATGTPHFDTKSKGAILGLTLSTTKQDIIKAILEGVTFEMKLNTHLLEKSGVKIDRLHAIGGGAKSEIWMQLKADIMNKPIVSLNVTEAACLGAAILAGAATSEFDSIIDAAKQLAKPKQAYEPDKQRADNYEQKFLLYRQIYPTIARLNHQM
jgi:xylulokinase